MVFPREDRCKKMPRVIEAFLSWVYIKSNRKSFQVELRKLNRDPYLQMVGDLQDIHIRLLMFA